MSDNAEEGIARVQTAATRAQGTQEGRLRKHHERSVAYLDERIFTFLFMLALGVLIVIWATTTSIFLLYSSLIGVILLTILWGVLRIRRIERTRLEQARLAREWQSEQ